MGSDGNIMPFNIFTKLFLNMTADQLVATKDATKLRTAQQLHNYANIK